MKKGDFEGYVVSDEFQSVKCRSTKEAFKKFKELFSAPDCFNCMICCNGRNLTNNVLLMGGKRGW